MNTTIKLKARWNTFWIAGALLAAAAAGCTTAGYKKSDVAAWNSEAAAADVQAESRQLQATIAALNDLVTNPATNARPQFLTYSTALDRLVGAVNRADRQVNRMWAKRSAYFKIWDQQIPAIRDEDLRQSSQARRQEVSNQFDAVSREYDEGQAGVRSVIGYLQDIRKALGTDLTRNGLAAVQPSASNATDQARSAQSKLNRIVADLDALSARTASFRVQEVK